MTIFWPKCVKQQMVWVGRILSLGSAMPIAASVIILMGEPGWTKPQPDRFPPNPLEIQPGDPLQPLGNITGIARSQLQDQLASLNQQALAQLQAGDDKTAFDIWNRQLRLSRKLSLYFGLC